MADILGTVGNDLLLGTAGMDRLDGLAGDDILEGGPAADQINGGPGRDTVVYTRSEAGVGINLGSPNGQGANNPTGAPFNPGDAFGDRLSGIENVIGSRHVDAISGDGYDNTLTGGAGGDFLYGGLGTDTADYTGSSAVDVDLARFINVINMSSQFGGDAEGDQLGAIENVNGSDENDRLAGNSGVNRLDGKGGDDILEGRGGGDFLIGGSGFDTASYQFAPGPVDIRLHNPVQSGGTDSHGDRLVSIEGLVGSAHNDFLSGDMANNIFRGGAGADFIDGGWGRDRASYAASSAAVDVDLMRTGAQSGGDAAGDILRSIEKLTGSDHNDRLAGDDMDNEFSGGLGADIIDGRGGQDFVDYRGSTGIDVDLGRAFQIGGHAEGDQLHSIEGIRGSLHDDRLVGSTADDHLIGDNGNDYLDVVSGVWDMAQGGNGDDTVAISVGQYSNAYLYGGDGTDTLLLRFGDRGPINGAVIDFDLSGNLVSWFMRDPDPGWVHRVTATGFERLEVYGTQAFDDLRGLAGADILMGLGGNDTIVGGWGDYLDGGTGNDQVYIDYSAYSGMPIIADFGAGTATGIAAMLNFERFGMTTGAGDDHIVGGFGENAVSTNDGSDFVHFSGQRNSADLGAGANNGFDTYIGSDYQDDVYVGNRGDIDGGGGDRDLIHLRLSDPAGIEVDALAGEASTGISFRNFERFRVDTSDGNDTIRLGNGNDYAYSSGGDDWLEGRGGNDDLRGAGGADSLDGGDGDDQMWGGADADRFYFSAGHDVVTDFNADAGDRIVITAQFQHPGNATFAALIANAQESAEGLRLFGATADDTLLLAGLGKADLTAADIEYLV